MNTYLITPPYNQYGDDFDMLARAFDPQQAVRLFELNGLQRSLTKIEERQEGPDDNLWTVRLIPPFADPLNARLIEWAECQITFWSAS